MRQTRERSTHRVLSRSCTTTLALLALLFTLVILDTPRAFASVQGAVWTTDASGTIVDQNIYVFHTDVYFNGGPQNGQHSGLPDGIYYFEVTDPSGGTLLSTDNASCRQVQVINGVVTGSYGPSCKHPEGAYNPANGSTTVQLAPFATTPNGGNEYKAWLIAAGNATISTTNPTILNFKRSDAKTDNFKVQNAPPPPPPILGPTACNPTSSVSILLTQTGVTAYVPNGNWASPQTGVQVVPISPAGTPTSIATRDVVNSCSSNSTSGTTVCTANGTDVYLINGTTLTSTLTSAASGNDTDFSGGGCLNCGVAVEANSNKAVIEMSYANAPSGSALQFLDLATNTFETPIPANNQVSEDVLWDPIGNRILSPNEDGVYDIFELETGTTIEYGWQIGGTLDSAGEDCLTGIALSTDEYTSNIVLADLTQATYSIGNPASWTAPMQFVNIPEWAPYTGTESGTDGVAVATGSHYGIITGEFPFPPSQANAIMAILLPSTSGVGTPSLVDYAVATMPNDPAGYPFSVGCDPHTVAAYVDPSTGTATGLLTDYGPVTCYSGGAPQYVALVNLQALMNAPRVGGTHNVSPSYDLVANQVVKFVATH